MFFPVIQYCYLTVLDLGGTGNQFQFWLAVYQIWLATFWNENTWTQKRKIVYLIMQQTSVKIRICN